MNKDIRVHIGFFRHLKTTRLRYLIGADGVMALIQLWGYTAENKPDGFLEMDSIDIEIAAGWQGEAGKFFDAIIQTKFLDNTDSSNIWYIHDWDEHQPWVVGAKERSKRARINAQKRWDNASSNASSMPTASKNDASSNAPLPSSPLPSLPINKNKKKTIKEKVAKEVSQDYIDKMKERYTQFDVPANLERFYNYVGANGKKYKNYNMAFGNWMSNDYPKIMTSGRATNKAQQHLDDADEQIKRVLAKHKQKHKQLEED